MWNVGFLFSGEWWTRKASALVRGYNDRWREKTGSFLLLFRVYLLYQAEWYTRKGNMDLRKFKPKINKRVCVFGQQSWKGVFWMKKKVWVKPTQMEDLEGWLKPYNCIFKSTRIKYRDLANEQCVEAWEF